MIDEKWMSLSTQQVEEKLNTSAASGLSRKAARERFQKAGENAFFLLPNTSPGQCIRSVLMQPPTILLLLISILLMLFDEVITGRSIFAFTLICSVFLIAMRLWTGHAYRMSARASRPLARVIREGQLFYLDCSRIVPGDLIELHQGDTVPCDVRLIGSQNLRVLTYLGEKGTTKGFTQTEKNGSNCGIPYVADICKHTNMLYGGSVIEQGNSRALVVETGVHTYIGALQGGFFVKTEPNLPSTVEKMKKIASVLQICLLLSILPITCICLLIGKTESGLPLLFSTLLCLCLANLSGYMDILFSFGMAIGVHRTLFQKGAGSRALIKSNQSPDRIADTDILLMFGPQAFSAYHPLSEEDRTAIARAGDEYKNMMHHQELRLALGDQFLESRESNLKELREAGIQPILILEEESRQAITYILRTGIVDHSHEIALASQFHARSLSITSNFGEYQAYCGFSNEELRELMIYLQKRNKKIAVLGCTPREAGILSMADTRFVCVNDLTRFSDSHRTREKKPQMRREEEMATLRMRQRADVLIPCADQHSGGIASIVQTFHAASDTICNMLNMIQYLIYAQIIRILFVLPPMLLGVHMIRPQQVVLSGLCMDLLLSAVMLFRVGDRNPQHIRASAPAFRLQTIPEAVCAAAITLLSFWGIHTNYADTTTAAPAMLWSMIAIQFTFFLICWNPLVGIKSSANLRCMAMLLIILALFIPIGGILGMTESLGFAKLSAPYGYLILIGPISVILTSLIIRFYRTFRSH